MMAFLPILGWGIVLVSLAAVTAFSSFRRAPSAHSSGSALAESAFAMMLLIPTILWVGAKLFHVRVDIFPVLVISLVTWLLSRWRSH